MRTLPLSRIACIAALAAGSILAAPAQAQDLKIAVAADVTSIDPHFFNLFPNNNIAEHIFDKLVQMDADSRMIPGLATSWKAIDPTDLGVQAAQGRQVPRRQRADRRGRRVLDRPRRADPEQPGAVRRLHQGDHGQADRRSVHDPLQDRGAASADAERPVDDLHRQQEGRDRRATEDFNSGKATIGSGRYKFVRYANGDRVELVRNDAYWGDKAPLDKVTFRIIKNEAARVAALLSGDVDAIEQPPIADLAARQVRSELHGELEDLAPGHLLQLRPPRSREPVRHRQGRQAAGEEPAAATCACAARSARRSTARRSPTA